MALEPRRPGDLRAAYFVIDRARSEPGWEPSVPLREGLAQTVAAFRGQGSVEPPGDR